MDELETLIRKANDNGLYLLNLFQRTWADGYQANFHTKFRDDGKSYFAEFGYGATMLEAVQNALENCYTRGMIEHIPPPLRTGRGPPPDNKPFKEGNRTTAEAAAARTVLNSAELLENLVSAIEANLTERKT